MQQKQRVKFNKEFGLLTIHLTKYKTFQLQFETYNSFDDIRFKFEIAFSRNCDHPGVSLDMVFFTTWFNLRFYDIRHLEELLKQN